MLIARHPALFRPLSRLLPPWPALLCILFNASIATWTCMVTLLAFEHLVDRDYITEEDFLASATFETGVKQTDKVLGRVQRCRKECGCHLQEDCKDGVVLLQVSLLYDQR